MNTGEMFEHEVFQAGLLSPDMILNNDFGNALFQNFSCTMAKWFWSSTHWLIQQGQESLPAVFHKLSSEVVGRDREKLTESDCDHKEEEERGPVQ